MARQDLLGTIRNALERGESTEQAKASLVNAGYNLFEIEEAAKELGTEEINMPTPIAKKKKKFSFFLIILIIFFLLGIIALLIFFLLPKAGIKLL